MKYNAYCCINLIREYDIYQNSFAQLLKRTVITTTNEEEFKCAELDIFKKQESDITIEDLRNSLSFVIKKIRNNNSQETQISEFANYNKENLKEVLLKIMENEENCRKLEIKPGSMVNDIGDVMRVDELANEIYKFI